MRKSGASGAKMRISLLIRKSTDRPKSLVIISPSRYGKTEWARSLGSHIYLSSYFNLDTFLEGLPTSSYLVLDDIPVDNKPFWKSFFGGQKEFTLTDKYRKKVKVRWGKPCIYLCNPDLSPWAVGTRLSTDFLDWLDDNTVKVTLTNKLY